MLTAKGIPNQGSTCYLNALIQALVGLPTLIQRLTNNDICKSISTFYRTGLFNYKPFLSKLPVGPFDSHETLMMILDDLPKDLFKLVYRAVQKRDETGKIIFDESLFDDSNPDTNINFMIMYYCRGDLKNITVPTMDYFLSEEPTILIVVKDVGADLHSYPDYKLMSFIDFTGSHYVTHSLRGDKFYLFNDSSVTASNGKPTKNTVFLFYERM